MWTAGTWLKPNPDKSNVTGERCANSSYAPTDCSVCGKPHRLTELDAGSDQEFLQMCSECFRKQNNKNKGDLMQVKLEIRGTVDYTEKVELSVASWDQVEDWYYDSDNFNYKPMGEDWKSVLHNTVPDDNEYNDPHYEDPYVSAMKVIDPETNTILSEKELE
jgi:hypothetical protein